jgi:hypothetical protein
MHHEILGYIDPGSGSIILQMLIVGFLGSLFMAKTSWRRVTGLLGLRVENS